MHWAKTMFGQNISKKVARGLNRSPITVKASANPVFQISV